MVTLILVPGIMSDARTWHDVVLKFGKNATVHVADTSMDPTLSGMAARAIAETKGDLVVMGHSMGGRVAMEIGRRAPDRVRAMVLANTGHLPAGAAEPAKRQERIDEANADMASYARAWVPTVIAPENRSNTVLVRQIEQMVLDCSAEVHERQNFALLNRPDASKYLPDFKFPVLLITGAQDPLSTPAHHQEIADLLSDAESFVVDHAGHLSTFEQPDAVSRIIGEWLERQNIRI